MHRSDHNRWTAALAVALVMMIPMGCLGHAGGTRPLPASGDTQKITALESLELKRRNWESHGTDVIIGQDGSFTVTAVFLGRSKLIRKGKLEAGQLDMLREQIADARFFALPLEYKAPFKTKFRWWGYELTLNVDQEIKSVRFHSEDDTVPQSLNRLLETILSLTK